MLTANPGKTLADAEAESMVQKVLELCNAT